MQNNPSFISYRYRRFQKNILFFLSVTETKPAKYRKQDTSEEITSLKKMRYTLTLTVLVICLKTGSGLLSQKPQDSVAVAGKSTYFNCSTSDLSKPIEWYHYHSNEVQRESIYRYSNFTEYWYPCYRNGRYVVEGNKATGTHNMVIPTVVSSDAGRFLCEVEGDEGMATLTVKVESNPTCVASEICKPYSAAIICIILIVLPIAIGGTILVLWYLRVYRQKKQKQKENKEADANDTITNTEASSPVDVQGRIVKESRDLESKQKDEETKPLLCAPNDLASKIKDLETELERERSEAKEREGQLRKQSDEIIEKLKETNEASERKVIHLKAKVKDLERSLYPAGNIDYVEKPTLVHTIITDVGKERREPINGMAILGKELFVSHEKNSIIEVYDSEIFKFGRNWAIEGMSQPMDIASCKTVNCLYIIYREDCEAESDIMKLDPKGKLIKKWSTGGERGRLSTYESNVIVCLFEKQVIDEYTTDGKLIRTVSLSPALDFKHPSHAIKVTGSHFAVCHGDVKDELHRVCIVDIKGSIVKELKIWGSKQNHGTLNIPICLAQDSERSILVADKDNQKIRLLNSFLKLQRNLIKQDKELDGHPVRICLDETKGSLFVAANTLRSSKKEWKDGRILIFNIR